MLSQNGRTKGHTEEMRWLARKKEGTITKAADHGTHDHQVHREAFILRSSKVSNRAREGKKRRMMVH
jgi:hypothetical protein